MCLWLSRLLEAETVSESEQDMLSKIYDLLLDAGCRPSTTELVSSVSSAWAAMLGSKDPVWKISSSYAELFQACGKALAGVIERRSRYDSLQTPLQPSIPNLVIPDGTELRSWA